MAADCGEVLRDLVVRRGVVEAIVGHEPLDARAAAVLARRIGGHSLQIAWRRAWGARERRSEGKQGGEQEEPHRRLLNTDALRLTLLQLQPPSNYKSVTLPLPCYLLPKTNFLRFLRRGFAQIELRQICL